MVSWLSDTGSQTPQYWGQVVLQSWSETRDEYPAPPDYCLSRRGRRRYAEQLTIHSILGYNGEH